MEGPEHSVYWISHDDYMTRELRDHLNLRAYLIPARFRLSGLLADMLDITRAEARIFFQEKPDLVVTTGAEICIPICFLAKLAGKKVVFIESLCRVESLSATGRIVYPIADLFLVQWPRLAAKYRKARYEGKIV
jgi:UDP-N-acetylglucosamine:LPS N-acetylglucosamine transferase